MAKHHRAGAFGVQDQSHFKYQSYFTRLQPDTPFECLFDPVFWAHSRERLEVNDIIRAQAYDGSFDVFITVAKKFDGGVQMRYLYGDLGPNVNPAELTGLVEERCVPLDAEGNPVVRVDFVPATKWRVIGLDNKEVIRNLESEAEAIVYRDKYLAEMHMRLPTSEESQAGKEAGDAADAARAARTKKKPSTV
jgi:hypothetical protein